MGAYVSLAALVIQVVFLGVVLSFVAVHAKRIIERHLESRQKMKPMSHAEAARARARARSVSRSASPSF